MIMPSLQTLLSLVLVAACVAASPVPDPEKRSTPLKSIQGKIYVGTATELNLLNSNSVYSGLVHGQFNALTPSNEMKWDATEPSQGRFTFGSADATVAYAEKYGMRVRGHTMVWHSQTPSWVSNLDATALTAAMKNHITTVMTRYKGKLYAMDVLNEIFSDNGDGSWRSSFWYQKLGKTFPEIALTAARAADSSVKLYINDYSIEGINAKSTALYNLASQLKSKGLLDGVGFQTHLTVGQVPSNMQSNLQRFANLGLDVAITELDIRMRTPASAANLAQQAKDYASVVNICQAVSRCVGVTVWGVGDADSWIPSAAPGWGAALLYDSNYQPKAAYTSFAQALAS